MPPQPSFFARLWLAIVCWFRIVFDAEFAARVIAVRQGTLAAPAEKPVLPATTAAPPPSLRARRCTCSPCSSAKGG